MTTTQANVENLSFEQALAELEKIVQDLESGKAALEDSIGAYERGVTLKKHCEQKLREAQAKIEQIVVSGDRIDTAPFTGTE